MKLSRRELLGGAAAAAVASRCPSARAAGARPPVLFVSHGSPLFLPGNEARVAELRAWGARLSKPSGIVVMTPHFAARRLELGATGRGFTWYDLPVGIKKRLPRDLEYTTPPSIALAARIEAVLGRALPRPERPGFDHTTWMPLKCMFPAADVPVVELGYPYVSEGEAFALGRSLAPLRDEGVLFLASGGMTHNLAASDEAAAAPPEFARDFDAWACERLAAGDVDSLVAWRQRAPAARLAHPDDGAHYRVLVVAAGVAEASRKVSFPIGGFESSLSKRCVEIA